MQTSQQIIKRMLHLSSINCKSQAGRYKSTPKKDFPLTYEMANKPHHIAHRKSWNSWNTCRQQCSQHGIVLFLIKLFFIANLVGGLRSSETAVEDMFIRKFMVGTWHSLFLSEVIIKRQHNLIRIAGIISRSITARKMYFLIGYTEELLSYWLQCPVKLELQTAEKTDVIFKYI